MTTRDYSSEYRQAAWDILPPDAPFALFHHPLQPVVQDLPDGKPDYRGPRQYNQFLELRGPDGQACAVYPEEAGFQPLSAMVDDVEGGQKKLLLMMLAAPYIVLDNGNGGAVRYRATMHDRQLKFTPVQ